MTKETVNLLLDVLTVKDLPEGVKQIINNLLKVAHPSDLNTKTLFEAVGGAVASRFDINKQHDYRLLRMTMSGYRSFPKAIIPYGIGLKDNQGNPSSLFLIGSNGTGKSSLFAALESYYTGFSSLAQERHVESRRFQTYGLCDAVESNVQAEIVIKREAGNTQNLATSAAFCSNYDIQKIEFASDDLTDYILSQLGYGEVLQIQHILDEERQKASTLILKVDGMEEESSSVLADVVDEYFAAMTGERSKDLLLNDYTDVNKIRDAVLNMGEENVPKQYFHEDWERLLDLYKEGLLSAPADLPIPIDGENPIYYNKEEIDLVSKSLVHKYNLLFHYCMTKQGDKLQFAKTKLEELYNRCFKARQQEAQGQQSKAEIERQNEQMKQRLSDIDVVKSQLKAAQIRILNNFTKDFKTFIEKILTDFSDGESFELKSDKGLHLDIRVTDHQGTSFTANPNDYFNSFRFVLYCVSLKLALALWQMKTSKVITPIVIDDVFDASDFENGQKLEEFVYQVFRTYSEKMNETDIRVPLQLIILTHDELMRASFERGLLRYKTEASLEGRELLEPASCLCGRLFSAKDIDKLYATKHFKKRGESSFRCIYIDYGQQ